MHTLSMSNTLSASQYATYLANVQASRNNRARINETLKAVRAALAVSK